MRLCRKIELYAKMKKRNLKIINGFYVFSQRALRLGASALDLEGM